MLFIYIYIIINMRSFNCISMYMNPHFDFIRILLTLLLCKDSLTLLKIHILIEYRDV